MKRGKRYQEAEKLIDRKKSYAVKEALDLIEKMPKTKFDETVELHVKSVSYTHLDVYKRQQ